MTKEITCARFTSGRHYYIPVEVVNYICRAVREEFTDAGLAWRLWRKSAWTKAHADIDFDRHSLREVLRHATGIEDSSKILHHWHPHRNIADVDAIASCANAIADAVDNDAYEIVTIVVND